MAKSEARSGTDTGEQPIEQLQKRYQDLNRRKIQAETQRDSAKTRVDELRAQAREKYGTDDVAALEAKLTEIIGENARKRAKYQEDLDRIEQSLAEVEAKFSDPSAGEGAAGGAGGGAGGGTGGVTGGGRR